MRTELSFQYAIQRPDGQYYNGNAYGDDRDWTKKPMEIYTYTEKGAYYQKDLYPAMFSNCKVVHYF